MRQRQLGGFTYKVLTDPLAIAAHLREHLRAEWLEDLREFPEQPWTRRWLASVASATFELRELDLGDIRPLSELMSCKTDDYDFSTELADRLAEAREELSSSRVLEPLVVLDGSLELIDGYMRFTFLNESGEARAFAYVVSTPAIAGLEKP